MLHDGSDKAQYWKVLEGFAVYDVIPLIQCGPADTVSQFGCDGFAYALGYASTPKNPTGLE